MREDVFGRFDTRAVLHAQIEHDDVGFVVEHQGERLFLRRGLTDHHKVRYGIQQRSHADSDQFLRIDDEHARRSVL